VKRIYRLISILLIFSVLCCNVNAEEWESINLASEDVLDRGLIGGEGCQYSCEIEVSRANPMIMMMGTDVGGMFRSFDEGKTWEECNVGFKTRGVNDIEFDPKNEKHVIVFNSNETGTNMCGIYVTVNGGDSWIQGLEMPAGSSVDTRDQLVFDPTSYDEKTGMCMVGYYTTPNDARARKDDFENSMYKTVDGGFSWKRIENSDMLWDSDLVVTDVGELYVGGQGGFFISSDQGKTFEKTFDGWVLSIDYVSARPDNVYMSTHDEIYISSDRGRTFEPIQANPKPPKYDKEPTEEVRFMGYRYFNVSPLNPNNMVISAGLAEYNWQRWYSRDGGKSWHRGGVDYLTDVHYSTRQPANCWSYLDENTVFSTGGDWITKSTNGGQTYRNASQGISVFMAYSMSINHNNPDKMFLSGQDYGSFSSHDGGNSWLWSNALLMRGGNVCDGWIVDDELAFAIGPRGDNDAQNFKSKHVEKPLALRIARGYRYMQFDDVVELDPETFFCYQAADDTNVLFAGVLRSTDRGNTWQKMKGCRGVLAHNADPNGQKELYGIGEDESVIVVSYDNGLTWKTVKALDFNIDSMAYDWKNGYVYATKFDLGQLHRVDVKTKQSIDVGVNVNNGSVGKEIWDVAVDPVEPNIVYIAGPHNYVRNTASVQRSMDCGESFEIITKLDSRSVITEGAEGPGEANAVVVHPVTREVWVTTQCYGLWKIEAPGVEHQEGSKLYAGQKEDSVYIRWYGNGKYDLEDIALMASISIYNIPHDGWYEILYENFWDGAVVHDEQELDVVAWHAFNEWENPIYAYDVMKSTDGINFKKLKSTNDIQFTDTDVEKGVTYYYKVVNLHNGETTVTKTVTVE